MSAAPKPSPILEKSYTLFCLDGEQQTLQVVEQVAHSACPVLIVGESGTGKRNLAEKIHAAGSEPGSPFHVIVCAEADHDQLIWATREGGTLYLREVGELSAALQLVLMKSAGSQPTRVIASSRTPLADAVRVGGMAEDFFYSIAGITLHTVPLRHRRDEILAIADQMLGRAAAELGKPKPSFDREFEQLLLNHSWPGNLAELDSAMRACVLIGNQEFAVSAMRASMSKARSAQTGTSLKQVSKVASQRAEQALISQVLHATGGNRKKAAKELKISYKALLYKLKKIDWNQTNGNNGEVA